MATAIEKIDKIENVQDDGTSTKLSDQTTTTRESESTMDNGEWMQNRDGMWKNRFFCPSEHENVNQMNQT